jgi:stalled ribosome rescue protein Dom34
MSKYLAVWIDQKEARVFPIHSGKAEETTVTAPLHNFHRKHPHKDDGAQSHANDAKRFFCDVAQALEGAEQILVVGPSHAKLDLLRYLHEHNRSLEAKVVGIETVDHPTDGQLVAQAKKYFGMSEARVR